jgi:CDGSH-type Zn-finger protein
MAELKPTVYAAEPEALKLEPGKTYLWCACGQSKTQPFCDGNHQDSGIQPLAFQVKNGYTQWLCNCKHTRTPPYCDGAHNKLEKLA